MSLHMIQSLVSWWVYKRRFGKTVSGTKWPLHQLWAGNEALYMRCQEAVRAIQRSCANICSKLNELDGKHRCVWPVFAPCACFSRR